MTTAAPALPTLLSTSDPLFSLGTILGAFQFEVPEYQRGYAWGPDEWAALWQDLTQVAQRGAAQHFTGNLFLRHLGDGPDGPGCPRAEVVDGQQRLVTTMVLSHVLALRAGRPTPVHRLEFVANEELQTHFLFHALGRAELAPRLSREPSSYALRLQRAREFFDQRVQQLDAAQAGDWADVLAQRFKLFVLAVSPAFDVHVAFETLNNRGRRLSHMELLKNRLIYLTTVLPPDAGAQAGVAQAGAVQADALRTSIHQAWKGIYRALGRSEAMQDGDDEFLLAHATCHFRRKREADWLQNTLFNQEFTLTNPSLTLARIAHYVQSLETAAAWWSHIHAPKDLPGAHQQWLARVARAGWGHFKPLALAAYLRAASADARVVIQPTAHAAALAPVLALLAQVERFTVVVYRLLGNQGSLGRADMHWAAHVLADASRGAEFTTEWGVVVDSTPAALALVTDFVRAWLDNQERDDGSFSDPRFAFAGVFDPAGALNAVDDRFRRHQGYYHWAFTRLVLFEYEEAFRKDGSTPQKLAWEQVSFDETVEHICPQNTQGKGRDYWAQHMALDGRSNRSGKLALALQNALGNLLLLSRGQNASASDHGYPHKRDAIYQNNTHSANELVHHFKDWDAQAMAIRSVAMLRFVERRWQIALTATPNDLTSYLPLCFGPAHTHVAEGKAGRKVSMNRLVSRVGALGPAP